MAIEWIDPESGVQVLENSDKEYIHPVAAIQFQENQAAAAVTSNWWSPILHKHGMHMGYVVKT